MHEIFAREGETSMTQAHPGNGTGGAVNGGDVPDTQDGVAVRYNPRGDMACLTAVRVRAHQQHHHQPKTFHLLAGREAI